MSEPERPTLGELYGRHVTVDSPPPGSLGQMYSAWLEDAPPPGAVAVIDLPAHTVDTRHRRRRSSRAPAAEPSGPASDTASDTASDAEASARAARRDTGSVARSSAIMAAGTFVSRILGLVRTILLAGALGKTSATFNIFDTANTLPNMIYLLLAGGVINAVLVPQITRALKHADGGKRYTDRLLTLALTILMCVTVVLMIASPLVYRLFDLHATGAHWKLGTLFALFCLPQVLFYGIYTLFGEVLNARSNFGPLMWSPAIANIIQIGGLAWFIAITSQKGVADPSDWTMSLVLLLAGTTTLGIVAQALVLIIPMRRVGYTFTPDFHFRGSGLRTASRIATWAFAAVILQQVVVLVTTNVLNSLPAGVGARGAQSYAFLLFMLPHSLITLSLVTALYTRMSKSAGDGRAREVVDDIGTGMRLSGLASVAVTVGAIVLIPPLVSAMYGPYQSFAIAAPTVAMMLGTIPFTVCVLVQRVFFAYEDAKTPFRMQAICTVVAIGFSLAALLLPNQWVGAGVASAQSLSYLVEAIISVQWLRGRVGVLPVRSIGRTYAKLAGAAIVGAGIAAGLRLGLTVSVGDATRLTNLLIVVVAGGVFVLVYVAGARLLRVTEMDQLVSPVTRRLTRLAHR